MFIRGSLVYHRELLVGGIVQYGDGTQIAVSTSVGGVTMGLYRHDELILADTKRALWDSADMNSFGVFDANSRVVRYCDANGVVTFRQISPEENSFILTVMAVYLDHDAVTEIIGRFVAGNLDDVLVVYSDEEIDQNFGDLIHTSSNDGVVTTAWHNIDEDTMTVVRIMYDDDSYELVKLEQKP